MKVNQEQLQALLHQGAQAIAVLRVVVFQAGGTIRLTPEARDAISPTAIVVGREDGDGFRLTLEEPQSETNPDETEGA